MIKSIYRQLMDSIKRKILSGELAVGDKLESERDMSKKYNISRMTVRRVRVPVRGCRRRGWRGCRR